MCFFRYCEACLFFSISFALVVVVAIDYCRIDTIIKTKVVEFLCLYWQSNVVDKQSYIIERIIHNWKKRLQIYRISYFFFKLYFANRLFASYMYCCKEKSSKISTSLFVYILRQACSILKEKVENKRLQKYRLLIA